MADRDDDYSIRRIMNQTLNHLKVDSITGW